VARSGKRKTLSFLRWLLLLPIPVLWCVIEYAGTFEFLENRTIDWRFYARGDITSPVKVVYIDIDAESIEAIGNWPWTRDLFADVLRGLVAEGGVRAVGFDIVISPQGASQSADIDRLIQGDRSLAGMIFAVPPRVPYPAVFAVSYAARGGISMVATDERPLAQIPEPEKSEFEISNGSRLGPSNLALIDTLYGGTRTVIMWAPTEARNYYTMSAELSRLYWGLPPGSIQVTPDSLDFVRPDGTLQATVPMREGQLTDVNWFSPWLSDQNPRQSFVNALVYTDMLASNLPEEREAARQFFAQDAFKDAIVLIGPTDPLMQDIATTSVDGEQLVPRVGVHGNMIKTIMSGQYIRHLSTDQRLGIVFLLTLLVSLFGAAGGAGGLRSKLAAGLILTAYVYLAFQQFETNHLLLPLVTPIGSIFTTTFSAIVWQLISEERQKGRIKGLFGTYLSPELVQRMVESEDDPQLGGHEQVITGYFSDIQAFSTFSEKMDPRRLVELMNEYLTACTDIIQEEGGTLDKYIGDAVVAIFGAPVDLPDHAFRACVATQRVQLRIAELREKWKGEGDRWPDVVHRLRARLGLNTGAAIIGNMGSRSRFSYTMMGDNVNLAARMESGAKSLGVYTMVTESTKLECEKHGGDRLVFRFLDRIVVKGRSRPVPVHEIVGLKENVTDSTRTCLSLFAKGIAKYQAQEWDVAGSFFEESAKLEPLIPGKAPGVESNPSLVFIRRCAEMKAHPPPADWDGVYVMKEK
jgi:adenylate cyclase